MSRAARHNYCSLYYPCIKPRYSRNSSRGLVESLGFTVLRLMQWKVNVIKVHRYNMIKGCLHLPLFPVYICSKIFNFFLVIFIFYCNCRSSPPDLHCWRTTLLLLVANKQHKQTNKQSRLRTSINQNKSFERERTKRHGLLLWSW